ncbi:hypothetical protein MTR_4g054245 [Medicago truncatula]|uniref:Uncharacterized protein n=1 Tax=Medicago truncatula TaxID=3880 RepID=A0A072UHG5_MEDTR|nr:hypothetical protein MTR_4g025780 [Medicago truncatula]KEH29881.1 hypothetical protein MTR_4g054245 [Medicago truncatula]
MSTSGVPPLVYEKAVNAVYISSVFLKHLIESGMQLYLSFDGDEAVLKDVEGYLLGPQYKKVKELYYSI